MTGPSSSQFFATDTCLSSLPRKASGKLVKTNKVMKLLQLPGLHQRKASRTLCPSSSKEHVLRHAECIQRNIESYDDASTPPNIPHASSQLAVYDSESTRSHSEPTDTSSEDAFLGTQSTETETTCCEYERTATFITLTVSREDDADGDSRRPSGALRSAAILDGARRINCSF